MRKKGLLLTGAEKQPKTVEKDFLEGAFYKKKRDFGGHWYTDEEVWFLPVNLLIRRDENDKIHEIVVQYEGMKMSMFRIVPVITDNGTLKLEVFG